MKKYTLIIISLVVLVSLSPQIASAAEDAVSAVFGFIKPATVALKDPHYPTYPHRRILFPTSSPAYWNEYGGMNKYTFTTTDVRVLRKNITFYSAGFYKCGNGQLEMSLPTGSAPNSNYNHAPCSATKSDDFHFMFPGTATTTDTGVVMDVPVTVKLPDGNQAVIYTPLAFWQK